VAGSTYGTSKQEMIEKDTENDQIVSQPNPRMPKEIVRVKSRELNRQPEKEYRKGLEEYFQY
jgi:hypothetical protein